MLPKQYKAQTTMIFLLLIIVIFIGMAIFLLSFAEKISQSEYLNLYTHSLLSAILKTDTGIPDPACETTADLLACSFVTPTHLCGSQQCLSLAQQTINQQVGQFALLKEGFTFLLTVDPEGFIALPGGTPYTVEIGDPSVKTLRGERIAANERILKSLGGNSYILTVTLIVARNVTA